MKFLKQQIITKLKLDIISYIYCSSFMLDIKYFNMKLKNLNCQHFSLRLFFNNQNFYIILRPLADPIQEYQHLHIFLNKIYIT